LSGGGHHEDLLDPGQLGGEAVHADAGGVSGGAAGDVQAHPLQGDDLLAHDNAGLVVDDEAVADLVLVEGGHPLGGPVEDIHQEGVGVAEAVVDGTGAHLHGGEVCPVKFLGILLQCGVAVGLHVLDDGTDGGLYALHRVLPGKDGVTADFCFL